MKQRPMLRPKWSLLLLLAASSVLILATVPRAHAVTNYALLTVPSRVQESNSPGVVLSINVTGATVGTTYKFTWQVTDPSGVMHAASNQTGLAGAASTFVLNVSYPAQFMTNVNYVGNYTVNVQENNPTNIPSVATGHFQVGLTDGLVYPQGGSVNIQARGYANNSPVTISISHNGALASGYPAVVITSATGTLSSIWNVPANVSTGVWTIYLSGGGPAKTVPDTQTITIFSTNLPVVPPSSSLTLYYFLYGVLAVGAGGSGLLLVRKYSLTEEPFDEFFNLTGGELTPPTVLLIVGDPGSGISTLALQLAYRQLAKGKPCGLLSYDAPPSEMENTMRKMGWDVSQYVRDGFFRIVDSYSALAGNEHAPIVEQPDVASSTMEYYQAMGEVSTLMGKTEVRPVTIVVDSLTPVFAAAPQRIGMNFVRVLAAKVRNNQGVLIITVAKRAIPADAWAGLESMVDGLVEVTLTQKRGSLVRRLKVERLAGHKITPARRRFDIMPGRGIIFRKFRLPLKIPFWKHNAGRGEQIIP